MVSRRQCQPPNYLPNDGRSQHERKLGSFYINRQGTKVTFSNLIVVLRYFLGRVRDFDTEKVLLVKAILVVTHHEFLAERACKQVAEL